MEENKARWEEEKATWETETAIVMADLDAVRVKLVSAMENSKKMEEQLELVKSVMTQGKIERALAESENIRLKEEAAVLEKRAVTAEQKLDEARRVLSYREPLGKLFK